MKRNDSIVLKLSNVLYHFDEFYNRCTNELDMTDLVEEGLNNAYDEWKDCLESGEFVPKHYPDQANLMLEFCMDEFGYFKDIFDYTSAQIQDLAPGMILEKYSEILPVLKDKYELNQPDTIGVGGYDVDFDSYGDNSEPDQDDEIYNEVDLEDYVFTPGEYFTLHDMWKDGDEGAYEVIEDRGDRVLAVPTWKIHMSILPQDVIKKTMIKELVSGPTIDKNVVQTIDAIKQYVKDNSYFDSECSIDGDGDPEILFTTRENGDPLNELFGDADFTAGTELVNKLNTEFSGKATFSLETVDEWIHIYGKLV